MNLWAFRFILWYICILLVQPQNRFTFLWPLHIANLSFIIGAGLHIFSCLESRRPLLRLGPATILTFVLLFFTTLSQYFGTYQISPAWNPYLDIMVKNSLLLIMIEAMATSVERVWAVQMTALFATLKQLPLYGLTGPLAIVLIVASFIGAANSATYVLAMLTSGGDMDPNKKLRGFWGIAQGAITIMLILVGGTAALKALQTASIAAAFPFMLIMLVMCYSIIVALREDSAVKK